MAKTITTQESCKGAGEAASDEEAMHKPVKGKKGKEDPSEGRTPEFATARDFAKAVAMQRNLVEVGSALLGSKDTKGSSVRARTFETMLEYLYGKPAAAPAAQDLPVRVIWDIPMSPDEPKK